MKRIALPALLLLSVQASAFATPTELKPQHATYTVARDGKPMGDATYSLANNSDGSWTLSSVTKGSAGMAKLVGLDVREESTFRWHDGKAEGLRYDYKQDAAIKHKQRSIEFDWQAQQAHVRDNGKEFSYSIPPGTIDRSTVALILGALLAEGTTDATLSVAQKDHLEEQRFAAKAEENVSVPAGNFKAMRLERTDASGKARSWYARGTMLPLRVEQVQGDGSTIVMELRQR
jgi:Protein of unknown function (DUF3108)